MEWWAWMVLGSLLFATEMLIIDAAFYLVFIGLSAIIVGFLGWLGLDLAPYIQWLIFGSLSLISMVTFRRQIYDKVHANQPGYRAGVSGDFVVLNNNLPAGATDRVRFRGTDWTVINEGSTEIASGTRIEIARTEGLTLFVSADKAETTDSVESA